MVSLGGTRSERRGVYMRLDDPRRDVRSLRLLTVLTAQFMSHGLPIVLPSMSIGKWVRRRKKADGRRLGDFARFYPRA
jgi:hypothetical protein